MLAGLAVLILIMLISITGSQTFSPGNWHKQFKVGLGLDLSSGTEIVLKAATLKGATPPSGEMQAAISVLLNRVNGTGNSGAQVQQQGSDQLTVTVPGQPGQSTIAEVEATAKLSFRQVLYEIPYTGVPAKPVTPVPRATTSASAKASATPSQTATATPKVTPTPKVTATPPAVPAGYGDPTKVTAANMKLVDAMTCHPGANATTVDPSWKQTIPGYSAALAPWNTGTAQVVSCDASGNKYVLGPAVFDGTAVTGVTATLLTSNTQWVVDLTLKNAAGAAFAKLTETQYNTYGVQAQATVGFSNAGALDSTAIVLDGNVQSAPQTNGVIPSGNVEISGPQPNGFTKDQATQLANVLKFGALPIVFTPVNYFTISPQVGRASLDAGLLAGIIGLGLVIAYLFYYYRGLGLVSVSSLLLAALLAYLSVVILSRYQNFTMSLSAIAGLVVAIGITADSFIVYFERLRDEVRDGKTLRPAVEAGWKRARRTILVSDTVSFLAAVLLYHFAVSDVQGFAYTLGLTTLIDVVVVFLFTKPMVTLLAGTKFFGGGHKWSGLDPMRLGAEAPWRSGARRTVRTQRTGTTRSATGSSTPSKEE